MTEYRLRQGGERTSVSARAASLGDAMASVADGVVAVSHGGVEASDERRFDCAATAADPIGLLVDYLDELDYQRDVRRVLPVDNAATVERRDGRWRLSGTFAGAGVDDEAGPAVPGVLTEPRVRDTGPGWSVSVAVEDASDHLDSYGNR